MFIWDWFTGVLGYLGKFPPCTIYAFARCIDICALGIYISIHEYWQIFHGPTRYTSYNSHILILIDVVDRARSREATLESFTGLLGR